MWGQKSREIWRNKAVVPFLKAQASESFQSMSLARQAPPPRPSPFSTPHPDHSIPLPKLGLHASVFVASFGF